MKNSKVLLFGIFLVIVSSRLVFPQTFEWANGMSSSVGGRAIFTDANENSYITGYFTGTATFGATTLTSYGDNDIFIAKYDHTGNCLWVKQAGGIFNDAGTGISSDAGGNIYITGNFDATATFGTTIMTSSGEGDMFVAKYDNSGNFIWVKKGGGTLWDSGNGISTDANGNSYVTGSFVGPATFDTTIFIGYVNNDIFIAKYDNAGNCLWVKHAGGQYHDDGYGVSIDGNGNCYITGAFNFQALFDSILVINYGGRDIFIAKYNNIGHLMWVKKAGGNYDYESGFGITSDINGNSYITGSFRSTATFDSINMTSYGADDIFIAKYDTDGNCLWAKKAGGTGADFGYGVSTATNGGVYVTGIFRGMVTFDTSQLTSYGQNDLFIAKYGIEGNCLWAKQAGGTDFDVSNAISVLANGDAYLTGWVGGNTNFGSISLINSGGFISKLGNYTLTVTSPFGGEIWQALSQQNITWNCNNIANIKIEYTTNNGINWINVISSTPAASGSYTWTIPYPPSTQCKVRLSDVTNSNRFAINNSIFSITPALVITSPNGGQIWQALSQQDITWNSGNIANIKIEYTTNNGINWINVISSTPAASGSYTWTVPYPPSTQCKVRLSDISDSAIFSVSNAIFSITPALTIASPNGGQNWQSLSQQNITWTSNNIENINIEYTTNNGISWINIISSTPAASGSYVWTIPYPTSTQCKVRLSDVTNSNVSDISNALFSITSPLTITSPIGGQNWHVLSQQNITWTSGNIENIKIEYTTTNGTNWNEIVSSTPAATGSYNWTIPNTPSTQCKVRLSDVNYNSYLSTSNSPFTISPALTVTSPNGGQNWQVLSQQNITWNCNNIANIKIEYTTNNGSNWNEIISSTPASTGSYSWIIPNTPFNQCKVKLSDITDSTIFAQSIGVFNISAYPISAQITADSIWFDINFDGIETKQVNANLSNGLKLNYDWYVKNVLVAQGIDPALTFGTGDNWLKLKVTDSLNQIAYDSVRIKVYCTRSKTNGGIYSGVSQIGNQFYVTSLDKGVYRFDSTGVLPPAYLTGGSIQSTMAISNKNLLYVGSDDTRLYCFDVTLNSIWDKSTGGVIKASPSITTDGNNIYIGTSNGYLKALDANNGNSKWTFTANGGIISSPTIVELLDSNQSVIETIIYFGTDNGIFYALKDKGSSFEQYWSFTTNPDSGIISSPAISPDGMIFFGSKNGYLYRVKWDGTYQSTWQKNTEGKIASSPVIGKNDIVYVANANGYIYGYEKEFTSGSAPLKQFSIQSGVNGTPSIGADGNLYLGFNNGKFYKLEDTDGVTDLVIKWSMTANGGIEGPVLATENGIIVVGCTNGDIYIMKDPVTNTEGVGKLNLSWPTFKGNNKRNKVTRIGNFPTAVKDITELPTEYNLSQNYPNPFNPSTVINYQIPQANHVTIKVYDMVGNEIATLVNEVKEAGYHTATFNAENISTGVYFYRITAGEFVSTKKLILIK